MVLYNIKYVYSEVCLAVKKTLKDKVGRHALYRFLNLNLEGESFEQS